MLLLREGENMSEQANSPTPRYVTCGCQHCDGRIEFNANQLTEENSVIPCPHCGLETKLFVPQEATVPVGADQPPVRREGFFCGDPDFEAKAPSLAEPSGIPSRIFTESEPDAMQKPDVQVSAQYIERLTSRVSERQLAYIRDLGGNASPTTSKSEASQLIDQLLGEKRQREFIERERNLASYLHSEYDEAKRSSEMAEKGDIREAQMFLKDAWNERLWFWQDTFRTPDKMKGALTNEQQIKFFFAHGHRYKMPSEDKIRAILEALDAYSPTWDMDKPEGFFATLEQNYPEHLKQHVDFEELQILREIYANE
jgi:hypothetical protein